MTSWRSGAWTSSRCEPPQKFCTATDTSASHCDVQDSVHVAFEATMTGGKETVCQHSDLTHLAKGMDQSPSHLDSVMNILAPEKSHTSQSSPHAGSYNFQNHSVFLGLRLDSPNFIHTAPIHLRWCIVTRREKGLGKRGQADKQDGQWSLCILRDPHCGGTRAPKDPIPQGTAELLKGNQQLMWLSPNYNWSLTKKKEKKGSV